MRVKKYHTKATVNNVGSKWVNFYCDSSDSKKIKEAVSQKIGIPEEKIRCSYTALGHTDKEPQW